MPALTKAQKKQAQAAEDSFNRTYAAQFGEQRWTESLYPALSAPTRYAALVNRFAGADGDPGRKCIFGAAEDGGVADAARDAPTALTTDTKKMRLSRVVFPSRSRRNGTTTTESTLSATCALEAYHWASTSDTAKPDREAPFPQPQRASTHLREAGGEGQGGEEGLLSHWNLDAASLLAVSILDPRPGHKVLDLCAAPGGKSVAIAQCLFSSSSSSSSFSLIPQQTPSSSTSLTSTSTSNPNPNPNTASDGSPSSDLFAGGCLHSNELNPARNKRLSTNLQSYLPSSLFTSGAVRVLKFDGAESALSPPSQPFLSARPSATTQNSLPPAGYWGAYDKVLLDAPCSSERHVIHGSGSGIGSSGGGGGGGGGGGLLDWRSTQSKKQAKTQALLLLSALRAVRVGGEVLYATCSLSSDENDGVVDKASELVAKERKKFGIRWDFRIVDLSCRAGSGGQEETGKTNEGSEGEKEDGEKKGAKTWLEREWAEKTKNGWLVLPDHPSGGRWGPLFFTLLEKTES